MSSNQFLVDASTRHMVFIQRFAGGEVNKIQSYFLRVENELIDRLTGAKTRFQSDRLSAQLREVREIIAATYREASEVIIADMNEFGKYEVDFSHRMLQKATPVGVEFALPAPNQITSAIFTNKMSLAVGSKDKEVTIRQALREFEKKKAKQAVLAISDGFLLGRTNDEIVSDVRKLIDVNRQQGEALVRTIVNHTGSMARQRFYKENDDVIESEKWLSVLDERVTLICASLSGNVYNVGEGPYPPRHFSCRSVRIPQVKPEYNLGSSIEGDQPAKGADGVERVGAKVTFGGWLKTQPASFQREYLGAERYKLFSKGGLSIKKFTDRDGNVYTLDQLKKLEPLAFEAIE